MRLKCAIAEWADSSSKLATGLRCSPTRLTSRFFEVPLRIFLEQQDRGSLYWDTARQYIASGAKWVFPVVKYLNWRPY